MVLEFWKNWKAGHEAEVYDDGVFIILVDS